MDTQQFNLSERLEDLNFDEQRCDSSHNRTEMQGKIRLLEYYASQVGLKINVAKKSRIQKAL